MYYLYILYLSNGRLYKGVTEDLRRRINEHQNGKVISTKDCKPIKLIHYEAYFLKSDCLRREKFLKTNEGRKLLRQQIRDVLSHSGVV